MAFQAVLAHRLAALAEELTAAAADDLQPLAAQVNDLTIARDRYRARAEELSAANDALSLELEAGAAEREAARTATLSLEAAREQSTRLASQLAALETQFADLQRTHARAVDEAQHREAAHDSKVSTALSAAEDARRIAEGEVALLREELDAARATSRERLVLRLAEAFDQIGAGSSIEDVLGAAANTLAEDFPRVAVFGVNGTRLEARYQRGFAPDSGVGQNAPTVGDNSLLGQAALTDHLGLHSPTASGLPFPGHPLGIVTAPIVVRGSLLALIYADDDGSSHTVESSSTPARVADIIRRFAALRLDRLTVELKTMGELRAYARMLLDEVEYVYRADQSARKTDAERLERLTENLRCARQIYLQRVEVEGPAMAGILEEVLGAAIAAKSTTQFGRELASIAPQAQPLPAPAAAGA